MAKMKPTNKIAQLPNEIEILGCTEHLHSLELSITWPESVDQTCPCCGGSDFVRKGRSDKRSVYHKAIGFQVLILTFTLQRYKCRNPECTRNFTEQPYWLHPTLRMTKSLYLDICSALQTTASIRYIAQSYHVTESTVVSVLKTIHFDVPSSLPTTLCIDEFKGSAGTWNAKKKRRDVKGVFPQVLPQTAPKRETLLHGYARRLFKSR